MVYLILEDGNRYLKGKKFPLNPDILKKLKNTLKNYKGSPNTPGFDRLRNIIDMCENNGGIEYNEMKRLKNWFDNHLNPNSKEYMLIGGDLMKRWINTTLMNAENLAKKQRDSEKMKKNTNIEKPKINVIPKCDPLYNKRRKIMTYLKQLN